MLGAPPISSQLEGLKLVSGRIRPFPSGCWNRQPPGFSWDAGKKGNKNGWNPQSLKKPVFIKWISPREEQVTWRIFADIIAWKPLRDYDHVLPSKAKVLPHWHDSALFGNMLKLPAENPGMNPQAGMMKKWCGLLSRSEKVEVSWSGKCWQILWRCFWKHSMAQMR